MAYKVTLGINSYIFRDLKELLAKASPKRSADELAGIAAIDHKERAAAQICLSDLPLQAFLQEEIIPCAIDEVSRLIQNQFSPLAFSLISHHTVGSFRDWLLLHTTDTDKLKNIAYALTPEMVSATSKIMRNQDLITVAQKCSVITKFRTTMGLKGHIGIRLQPNHPKDSIKGIMASIIDGLSMGAGDALIGINPASDDLNTISELLLTLEKLRLHLKIPTQYCVLTHLTTQMNLLKNNIPMDLIFQSIGGSESLNNSFGINLNLLKEAYDMALKTNRYHSPHIMYFETGQGSALSANAHHGVDAQTCEVRAYAVAREFTPFLVNSVVGFIGPEYLYNGKEIIRAGLEDHFCGKILSLPMGLDICYTNHCDADQNDMDNLLLLLGIAGGNFIMGVPGGDDIMLGYQSTSFHDGLLLRSILGLKPAPEFLSWLIDMGIMKNNLCLNTTSPNILGLLANEFC